MTDTVGQRGARSVDDHVAKIFNQFNSLLRMLLDATQVEAQGGDSSAEFAGRVRRPARGAFALLQDARVPDQLIRTS